MTTPIIATTGAAFVAAIEEAPFEVPPFYAGRQTPEISYVWWSWHPNYPYWSKSCWGGKTKEEAWAAFDNPFASSMRYYHNKLIREGDGQFTEVADYPCQRMDVWRNIREQRRMAEKQPEGKL